MARFTMARVAQWHIAIVQPLSVVQIAGPSTFL